jgi:putative ABC transport system permease protein
MILPKIALRNLTRQKRRSILLGGALSFGMFVLVVVNGVTGGLVSSIQKNFSDMIAGHIFFLQVEKDSDGKLVNMIKDDKALMEALKPSGLDYKMLTRRTQISGTVIFGGESAGRQITGIDWKEDTQLSGSLKMLAGDASAMAGGDGILISSTLAEQLGILPKKTVSYAERAPLKRDLKIKWREEGKKWDLEKAFDAEIKKIEADRKQKQIDLAPTVIGESVMVQVSTIHGQQNVADFRVKGIFETQMDISAYVDREVLNSYVEMPSGTYNLFGLVLNDFSNLEGKTQVLNKLLKDKYNLVDPAKVTGRSSETILGDIKKENFTGSKTLITNLNNELGSLVSILTGIQFGSFVLFLIVIAVIMVGLVNTFRIVIYERTKEIGTMRAVGTQRKQIRNLFLLEALFLSVVGTVPGAVFGIVTLNVIHLFRFDAFTELAYFLDGGHVAFTVSPALLIGSFAMVILFTLIAALMPANRAAKMQPAEALRNQM